MTPTVVILTITAYFVMLFAVSHFASRRSDNAAFFTGNRRAPWPLVAFAMIGAAISGVTFISVPGMVVDKGYSYLQMALGFIAGYAVIAYWLIPLFYKRNLISIYGYLGERFGMATYKTGAWFFFISKILGASVRFFVVCIVLQPLVFDQLGVPFTLNVVVTITLIWLYTFRGGVKAVIWTDVLKSFCLIMSVVLSIYFIADNLGFSFGELANVIAEDKTSRIFYFDDPTRGIYFWKQFFAGAFMTIVMTGLDQDMMQRNLACRDSGQSQKNMIVSSILQFFVIAMFLLLGTLLVIYVNETPGLAMPAKSDELFGLVATHPSLPTIVGILFIIGLVSAAYSAAGSALTSLTTSFTVDILNASTLEDARLSRIRKTVHISMSALMGMVIILFYLLSEEDAISAVYTLASYTYGPILGMFLFGMFTKRKVRDGWVPLVCVLSPVISWILKYALFKYFDYEIGFELLIINALFTTIGLFAVSRPHKNQSTTSQTTYNGTQSVK